MLTFDTLRKANKTRMPLYKDKEGRLLHESDGSDWSPSDWLEALVGELGEYANKHKKFRRGDMTLDEFKTQAEKELADVQTYLDILAMRCLDANGVAHPTGVDLGQATTNKFNEISDRVGCNVKISHNEIITKVL